MDVMQTSRYIMSCLSTIKDDIHPIHASKDKADTIAKIELV